MPLNHGGGIRKAYASKGDDATFSRWVKVPGQLRGAVGKPKQGVLNGLGHPVVEAGRSIFYRKGVAGTTGNLLVSGHSNVKIGRDVRKGHFRGYWIYALSLEERATCPRSCTHWHDCYGNNMPWARRIDHRDELALERALEANIVRLLAVRGRRGILVRLHALGDFFDESYVEFWGNMLAKYDRLAVYGYTARRPWDQIGAEIDKLKSWYGPRFAIRWSDGGETDSTVSIITADDCPPNAFVCPEQTGQTKGCGTCGACWGTTKNVAFLGH